MSSAGQQECSKCSSCWRTRVEQEGVHLRHQGKTQIWNRGGVEPAGAAQLTTAARIENPDAMVWRGDPELPLTEQGLTVLGAPVGLEFVQAQLAKKGAEHEALLEMIPRVPNVQVAWLLILFCAGARANFLLRTVQPELTQDFARHHDEQLARCLRRVLHIDTMPSEVQVCR